MNRDAAPFEKPAVDGVPAERKGFRQAQLARDCGADGEIAGIAEVPVAGGGVTCHISIVFELNEAGQPGLLARPRGPLDATTVRLRRIARPSRSSREGKDNPSR
jgi:hypothetical protein